MGIEYGSRPNEGFKVFLEDEQGRWVSPGVGRVGEISREIGFDVVGVRLTEGYCSQIVLVIREKHAKEV